MRVGGQVKSLRLQSSRLFTAAHRTATTLHSHLHPTARHRMVAASVQPYWADHRHDLLTGDGKMNGQSYSTSPQAPHAQPLHKFLEHDTRQDEILPPTIQSEFDKTPDKWIERSPSMILLAGRHPYNAEPPINLLMQDMITPTELHFVRNHGTVPQLQWESHSVQFTGMDGTEHELSMDDLEAAEHIEMPVLMSCDGNRRKEFNMIKHSNAYNWGVGGAANALWKGARLSTLIQKLGLADKDATANADLFIHFEGVDELANGKYATSIPLLYAADPLNDCMLAFEMNGTRLPPDHGFPVRLMLPGYVGGRCVKWLKRIWVSTEENQSFYHLHDNTVLPESVQNDNDATMGKWWNKMQYKLYELPINSVVTSPSHEELISMTPKEGDKDDDGSYTVRGYAYGGGGLPVTQVDVTTDGGASWVQAEIHYRDDAKRPGGKVAQWAFWSCKIPRWKLFKGSVLTSRAWDRGRHVQPEAAPWNLMGMMNNGWYKLQIEADNPEAIRFVHPVKQGNEPGGWMKPSEPRLEVQGEETETSYPFKQITWEEIRQHTTKDDCWSVVDGTVYDFTPFLKDHPGGWASISAYAGEDASRVFHGIHSQEIHKQKEMWAIGRVAPSDKYKLSNQPEHVLNNVRWFEAKLKKRQDLSKDVRLYTFALPPPPTDANSKHSKLGLPKGQHMLLGASIGKTFIVRPYTPTRPLESDEENGEFDMIIKTYFPVKDEKTGKETKPGGKLTMFMEEMKEGDGIMVKGPTGHILYHEKGHVTIAGKTVHVKRIGLVVGGTALTPAYQLAHSILKHADDHTKVAMIYANKTMEDILLHKKLDQLSKDHPDQFKLHLLVEHIPDHHEKEATYGRGRVNEQIIREHLFEPDADTVAFISGPPIMVTAGIVPALQKAGYQVDHNVFEF